MTDRPTDRRPTDRRPWGFFVAWFAIGALYALSLLGALTIGVFVLPVAAGTTVWLATRRNSSRALAGLISGLGLPLLYVAYLNRAGPGTVCTVDARGRSCTDEWSPWPWLVLGIALVAAGIFAFVFVTSRNVTEPIGMNDPRRPQ